jgi:hypothetical protein
MSHKISPWEPAPQRRPGRTRADAVDEVGEFGADLGDGGGEDRPVVEVVATDPQGAVFAGLGDRGFGGAEFDGAFDLEGGEAEQPELVREGDEEVFAVAAEVDRQGAVVEGGGVGGLGVGDGALTRGRSLDRGLPPHGARAYHRISARFTCG